MKTLPVVKVESDITERRAEAVANVYLFERYHATYPDTDDYLYYNDVWRAPALNHAQCEQQIASHVLGEKEAKYILDFDFRLYADVGCERYVIYEYQHRDLRGFLLPAIPPCPYEGYHFGSELSFLECITHLYGIGFNKQHLIHLLNAGNSISISTPYAAEPTLIHIEVVRDQRYSTQPYLVGWVVTRN